VHIAEEIDRAFQEGLNTQPPADDVDLIATGVVDSLGIVLLLAEVERRVGICVPLDNLALDDIRTVGGRKSLLERAQSGLPAAIVPVPDTPAARVASLRTGTGSPVFLVHSSRGVPTRSRRWPPGWASNMRTTLRLGRAADRAHDPLSWR